MPNEKNDWESLLDDDTPLEEVTLDLNEVKKNVPGYSNQKLCEMIVCDRYFGMNQEIQIICMEELSKRRINGDTFNYEEYIEQCKKDLPVLDVSMPDIRTVLNRAISGKVKK